MTGQPIIRIEHVTATYGDKNVFCDISMDVFKNDFLGVIGPNGGGKTTLMKILLGLIKPASGRVSYLHDGEKVKNIVTGYLPQYNAIDRKFPISVYEVMLSGLNNRKPLLGTYSKEYRDKVDEMLEKLKMENLRDRHIGTLSGGQLQRVLLGRALVSRPEVIVLDEPNTYIDKKFQEQMNDMLTSINQECTIVLVTHDVQSVINNARNVALVNHSLTVMPVKNLGSKDLEECFGSSTSSILNRGRYGEVNFDACQMGNE